MKPNPSPSPRHLFSLDKIKAFIAPIPVLGWVARKTWKALGLAKRSINPLAPIKKTLAEHEAILGDIVSAADVRKLQRELLMLQRRLDLLLASSAEGEGAARPQPAPLQEGFYLAFENRFRGDIASIEARQAVYLPTIHAAGAGAPSRPILDIGCGRGEWLRLLQKNQLDAVGVDSDASMIAACKALNLSVNAGDAFEFMGAQDDAHFGAITGFHIAEHIPFNTLIALFDEALRVLKPGGVLILETPNPENLLVGACYFYTDPTHLRPLPPDLLAFVAENRGFAQVEIMRLHPFPQYADTLAKGGASSDTERFLFGPQDYALIARKPANNA